MKEIFLPTTSITNGTVRVLLVMLVVTESIFITAAFHTTAAIDRLTPLHHQPPLLQERRYHRCRRRIPISPSTLRKATSSQEQPEFDEQDDTSFDLEDAFDLERFQRQRTRLVEQKHPVPPHPSFGPQQVVETLLNELRTLPHFYDYDNSRIHPGVETLWRASAPEWQQTMASIVGLSTTTDPQHHQQQQPQITAAKDEETTLILPALGRFLARPNQQFAILLGVEDCDYWIDFPTDVIEWSDEEAWLECRLRDSSNDELLVVLGWTLTKLVKSTTAAGGEESSWHVQSFDWQDFRNAYRPRIGREEWERICG